MKSIGCPIQHEGIENVQKCAHAQSHLQYMVSTEPNKVTDKRKHILVGRRKFLLLAVHSFPMTIALQFLTQVSQGQEVKQDLPSRVTKEEKLSKS